VITSPPVGVFAKTAHPDQAIDFTFSEIDDAKSLPNLQSGLWMGNNADFLFGESRKLYVDDFPQHHPPGYVEAAIGSVNLTRQPYYKQFGAFHETWDLIIQPALQPAFTGKTPVKDAMARIAPQVDSALKKAAASCPPTTNAAWLSIDPNWGK